MTQYDKIAEKYASTQKNRMIRRLCSDPSFFKILGDVRNKDILDLGCGDGRLTREIKVKGAKKVVGIDISKEMIKLAKRQEVINHLGIKYFVKDVSKLEKIGEFDTITAGFLLHYSKTKKELLAMCKNIYFNLKPKGRFVTINHNPNNPVTLKNKYGAYDIAEKLPLVEGGRIIVNIKQENIAPFSFKVYHWEKETYENALKQAGFKRIFWHEVKPSKEVVREYGKEFWKDFSKHCTLIIIEAIK